MVIAQFGKLKFRIGSGTAMLFDQLKISAEQETDDKTEAGQKYVARKNGKPVQVSFSIYLTAAMGIDVKEEAQNLISLAEKGEEGYLYFSGEKLFPFQLLLQKAETEEIKIAPSGQWQETKVAVTLKQSTKDQTGQQPAGTGGGQTSGTAPSASSKASVKQKAVTTDTKPPKEKITAGSTAPIYYQTDPVKTLQTQISIAAGVAQKAKTVPSTAGKTQTTATARANAKVAALNGLPMK